MVWYGLIDPGKAREYASEVIGAFTVKATGPGALAGSLSGGNLQKFIMGREIMQRRGARRLPADLGGRRGRGRGHPPGDRRSRRARLGGAGHLAQDLDELLTLCDTIAVINLGRMSQPMKVGEVSVEEIGLLMGGVHGDPAATVEMIEALHAHPI